MNISLWIVFKSKNWENFSYLIFFIAIAFILYRLMKLDVKIRREKDMSEISTKGGIVKSWMLIIAAIFGAIISFLRLIF